MHALYTAIHTYIYIYVFIHTCMALQLEHRGVRLELGHDGLRHHGAAGACDGAHDAGELGTVLMHTSAPASPASPAPPSPALALALALSDPRLSAELCLCVDVVVEAGRGKR